MQELKQRDIRYVRFEMPDLLGPTPNCYRRLKPHTFAPSKVSWGIEDRSSMVRLKATHDNRTHFEILLTENELIEVP